jgi:hypothetical protein
VSLFLQPIVEHVGIIERVQQHDHRGELVLRSYGSPWFEDLQDLVPIGEPWSIQYLSIQAVPHSYNSPWPDAEVELVSIGESFAVQYIQAVPVTPTPTPPPPPVFFYTNTNLQTNGKFEDWSTFELQEGTLSTPTPTPTTHNVNITTWSEWGENLGGGPRAPAALAITVSDTVKASTPYQSEIPSTLPPLRTVTPQFVEEILTISDPVLGEFQHIDRNGVPEQITIGESLTAQYIPNPLHQTLGDSITVTQTIGADDDHVFDADGVLTQTITVHLSSGRSLTNTVAIQEYIAYFMPSVNWVNPITPNPTPPGNPGTPGFPWDPGNPRVAGKVTLTFGSTTLDLRFPDFGDKDTYEPYRIARKSRGGDLQVFQAPMWPTTEILDFKFSYIDPDDIASLIDFLKTTVGRTITLLDHYGRTWRGFILTPAGDVVNDKRTTSTVAFKFQPTSGPT